MDVNSQRGPGSDAEAESGSESTGVTEPATAESGTDMLDDTLIVERADADLYVERVGSANAPAVYYLHGGPGYNSHSFRDLVGDDLTGYQMLYADQRGAGRSYGSGSADLDVLATDVAAVLGALNIGGATLLAHGYGAMVAIQAAITFPQLIKGLVLVNPWLSMPLLATTLNRAAVAIAGGQSAAHIVGSMVAQAEDGTIGVEGEPEVLVDEAFSLINPKALFDALQFPSPSSRLRLEHSDADALLGPSEEDDPAGVWRLDVADTAGHVSQNVVVLAGQHDGTAYPVQAELALSRMPKALTSILDTGHYPWLDDHDTFIELLEQALAYAGADSLQADGGGGGP